MKQIAQSLIFSVVVLVLAWSQAGHAASRFSDNEDGTVYDDVTELQWQQEDDRKTRTWEKSLEYCEALSLAGHTDWRLPNIRELASLVDERRYDPAASTVFFPTTRSARYWSSTTYDKNNAQAWFVFFSGGGSNFTTKPQAMYVRCVR